MPVNHLFFQLSVVRLGSFPDVLDAHLVFGQKSFLFGVFKDPAGQLSMSWLSKAAFVTTFDFRP